MRSHHGLALLLVLGLAAAWLLLAGLALLGARLPAAQSEEVLVVFSPAVHRGEARTRIRRAGGLPLGRVAGPVWHAAAGGPGFVGRLEARGALLVLPAREGTGAYTLCGAGLQTLSGRAEPGPFAVP